MGPLLYVSARVHIGDSNCLSCKSSSHPKHGSGKMNSYVDVGVQIVMGLNPYLEEENRDLLEFCITNVEYIMVICTNKLLFASCNIRGLTLSPACNSRIAVPNMV